MANRSSIELEEGAVLEDPRSTRSRSFDFVSGLSPDAQGVSGNLAATSAGTQVSSATANQFQGTTFFGGEAVTPGGIGNVDAGAPPISRPPSSLDPGPVGKDSPLPARGQEGATTPITGTTAEFQRISEIDPGALTSPLSLGADKITEILGEGPEEFVAEEVELKGIVDPTELEGTLSPEEQAKLKGIEQGFFDRDTFEEAFAPERERIAEDIERFRDLSGEQIRRQFGAEARSTFEQLALRGGTSSSFAAEQEALLQAREAEAFGQLEIEALSRQDQRLAFAAQLLQTGRADEALTFEAASNRLQQSAGIINQAIFQNAALTQAVENANVQIRNNEALQNNIANNQFNQAVSGAILQDAFQGLSAEANRELQIAFRNNDIERINNITELQASQSDREFALNLNRFNLLERQFQAQLDQLSQARQGRGRQLVGNVLGGAFQGFMMGGPKGAAIGALGGAITGAFPGSQPRGGFASSFEGKTQQDQDTGNQPTDGGPQAAAPQDVVGAQPVFDNILPKKSSNPLDFISRQQEGEDFNEIDRRVK